MSACPGGMPVPRGLQKVSPSPSSRFDLSGGASDLLRARLCALRRAMFALSAALSRASRPPPASRPALRPARSCSILSSLAIVHLIPQAAAAVQIAMTPESEAGKTRPKDPCALGLLRLSSRHSGLL